MKVIESYLIQWIFSFLLRYFRNFPLKPNDKITNPIFRSLIVQRSIWISLVNVLLKNIRQALIWAVDFRQRLGLHIQFFWNSLMKWSISKISGVVKLFLVIFGFNSSKFCILSNLWNKSRKTILFLFNHWQRIFYTLPIE